MIHIDGVVKSFGYAYALRGVNLHIDRGSFLTIFGPNGAGKTTLLSILSTIIQPNEGKITIGGYDSKETPEKIRSQIGVISHQTFLYDDLTAYENLYFYGRMYHLDDLKNRIRDALDEVELSHRMDNRVREFSRGMQQRLAIARAALHDPPVLFMDEPYTGLDQHAAEILKRRLIALSKNDRTVIMTTHDIERGLETCNRVAILVKGKICYTEDKEKIDTRNFKEVYESYVGEGD